VLDVKQAAEHILQLNERVECLGSLIWKATDELRALALHLLVLVLRCSSNDSTVELTRRDRDIEAVRGERALRPLVIRCQEDRLHLLVLGQLAAYEAKGLGGSHAVQNVGETIVLLLLGSSEAVQELLVVDVADERIQLDHNEVLVGDELLGELYLASARRYAHHELVALRGRRRGKGVPATCRGISHGFPVSSGSHS